VAGLAPHDRPFRAGGWVVEGSVHHQAATLDTTFQMTDHFKTMQVNYHGILPDLFREGQAVVVDGQLDSQNRFIASQVLAKHDENYTPPPLRSLK
jgi:cytochrome c-type biogenesis protein CcmE